MKKILFIILLVFICKISLAEEINDNGTVFQLCHRTNKIERLEIKEFDTLQEAFEYLLTLSEEDRNIAQLIPYKPNGFEYKYTIIYPLFESICEP